MTTDDDVTMPSDWLEKLLSPFVQDDVMAVTGNVLPLELETAAQRLFEATVGWGRGFERLVVGRKLVLPVSLGRTNLDAWRHG